MMRFLTTTRTAQVYSNNEADDLYSYGKLVLSRNGNNIVFGKYWRYSVTTMSHIRKYFKNYFFNGNVTIADIDKALKDNKPLVINGIAYNISVDSEVQ